jgi:subtilisin family serine protease
MRNPGLKHPKIWTVLVLLVIAGSPSLKGAQGDEAIIVKCARPCAAVTAAIAAAGGEVTQRYQNVDAVAARVPKGALPALVTLAGADGVRKDVEISQPKPTEVVEVQDSISTLAGTTTSGNGQPANYNYDLTQENVALLHAAGKRGQNVVVAVIDSGTANVAQIPALTGSVIGGETFVPASQDPLSATHRENGSHGTLTAEMVAAHATFFFFNTSTLVRSLNQHAPGSAIPCTVFQPVPNCGLSPATAAIASAVPITGTAPGAAVYAMKVFPATGGGAPESRVIAAMDRAITLRLNYNSTGANTVASGIGTETDPFVYSALKIDVVNMSLGGPTLFAGRDITDQLTLAMLDAGITVVVAAGNDGQAAMTGGSPGTGFGSLTVGAANTAVHERVLRDNQFGFGAGNVYRASAHDQTAYFSARGPTADGRLDPDIVANGFASFGQAFVALTAAGGVVDCREPAALPGTCAARLLFVSGTSFSSPTTAGAAAVLRGAHPASSATQIRNALQQSANPNLLGDDSSRIDQGNGFLNVAAADVLLTAGQVSSVIPDLPPSFNFQEEGADSIGAGGKSVIHNVERAGFRVVQFNSDRYTTRISDLKPGQVAQLFVPSDALTSKLTVTIDEVTPELPLQQQNQFFFCGPSGGRFLCGDDVFVQIVDAPTSFAVERATGFPNAVDGLTADIANPQTGLVRVALQGDWTNAGRVSATVTITRHRESSGLPTATSIIDQDEIAFVEFDVPGGASRAVFELSWLQNWGRYPTNDLDLFLLDPLGNVDFSGATIDSPERVEIANPTPGRWTAAIVGFTIHGSQVRNDVYTFRAEVDGTRLKKVP